MTGPSGAPVDVFFDGLTRRYVDENPRFLRRDWLAARLTNALSDDTHRFVLLVGEPGAGKSVFMAQLARDNPQWLRYFIRHDQQRTAAGASARSFLLHVGFQLACLHPELFAQNEVRLSVEQRIGDAAAGSEVVGAEVRRLVASPFYSKVVEIDQQVVGIACAAENEPVAHPKVGELRVGKGAAFHPFRHDPGHAFDRGRQHETQIVACTEPTVAIVRSLAPGHS